MENKCADTAKHGILAFLQGMPAWHVRIACLGQWDYITCTWARPSPKLSASSPERWTDYISPVSKSISNSVQGTRYSFTRLHRLQALHACAIM